MIPKRKKVGLALGCGGVRGLAHIGVLKVLAENKIPIDYIAGCSVGAWVGAHYALFQDLEKLEKETIGNKREKLATFLEPSWRGGLIGGEKVAKYFRKYLNDTSFADCQIPFKVVATDLVSGEPVIFSQGDIVPAVRASIAVPTVFQPLIWENKVLVDGGISNPVPDDIVKEMGADIVISVSLDNFKRNGNFDGKKPGMVRVVRRTFDLIRYHLAQHSLKNSDVIIRPPSEFFGLRSWTKFFTEEIGEKLIAEGEREAEKMLKEIKDLLKEQD